MVYCLRSVRSTSHLVKLKKLEIAKFSVGAPALWLSNSWYKVKIYTAATQHVHEYGKYVLCAIDLVKKRVHAYSTRYE